MVLGLRMRGCLQGQRCGGHFRGVHSARGLRAIAALPRSCILIAACGGAVSSREGKEPRTTPGGAGVTPAGVGPTKTRRPQESARCSAGERWLPAYGSASLPVLLGKGTLL